MCSFRYRESGRGYREKVGGEVEVEVEVGGEVRVEVKVKNTRVHE